MEHIKISNKPKKCLQVRHQSVLVFLTFFGKINAAQCRRCIQLSLFILSPLKLCCLFCLCKLSSLIEIYLLTNSYHNMTSFCNKIIVHGQSYSQLHAKLVFSGWRKVGVFLWKLPSIVCWPISFLDWIYVQGHFSLPDRIVFFLILFFYDPGKIHLILGIFCQAISYIGAKHGYRFGERGVF